MPLFNLVKVYGADVAKVLDPDERLIAMGYFHTGWDGDASRLELADHELSPADRQRLQETGRRPHADQRFIEGVDWVGVHVNDNYMKRWIYGSAGRGAVDSTGGRLWRMIRDSKRSDLDWIVTDHRLAILTRESEDPIEFSIEYSVPRSAIRDVRRRGKIFFQWGRCELTFTDGSMAAMMIALFDISAARMFVRALSNDH